MDTAVTVELVLTSLALFVAAAVGAIVALKMQPLWLRAFGVILTVVALAFMFWPFVAGG